MSYTPVGWKDYPEKTTPTSAANLNKMESGIINNDAAITELQELVAEQAEEIEALKEENSELNNALENIDTLEHYSFEETIVGTWANGATIYRKVYSGTFSLPGNTPVVIDADFKPSDYLMINVRGVFIRTDGRYVAPNPYVTIDNSVQYGLAMNSTVNYGTGNYGIVVEYMKS